MSQAKQRKLIILCLFTLMLVNGINPALGADLSVKELAHMRVYPNRAVISNGKLFFVGFDKIYGTELWLADQNSGKVRIVKDIYRGDKFDNIDNMFAVDGKVYFAADDGTQRFGRQLWVSDGTEAGTKMINLTDAYRGRHKKPKGLQFGASMVSLGNKLIVVSSGNAYSVNKTSNQVKHLGEVLVNGIPASLGIRMIAVGDSAYAWTKIKIWKINSKVKTLNDKQPLGRAIRKLVYFKDKIYILADELWSMDENGKFTLIKDIKEGRAKSQPIYLAHDENHIYFTADDGVHGREIWRTDGTASGTTLAYDVFPGFESIPIRSGFVHDSKLYFVVPKKGMWTTDKPDSIYVTDNSKQGAHKIWDRTVAVGDFAVFNNSIYFSGRNSGRKGYLPGKGFVVESGLVNINPKNEQPSIVKLKKTGFAFKLFPTGNIMYAISYNSSTGNGIWLFE